MEPTVSNIIYKALTGEEPIKSGECKCVFCGDPAPQNYQKVIKPTFTDIDYLGDGCGVCVACEYALTDRKENSCRKMSAVYHLQGFERFTALELADILFNMSYPTPFFFALSYSKKKHLFYKGELSFSNDRFWIQTDDIGFWFEPKIWKPVFKLIQELYSYPENEAKKKNPITYFSKKEIESLNFMAHRVVKFGYKRLFEIKKELQKYKGNPIYEMLIYAVRPKQEVKNGRRAD